MDDELNQAHSSGPTLYTPIFEKVFPGYLSIGMTYDLFWEQDCKLVKAYIEAEKIRQKRLNEEFWMLGHYIYDAVGRLHPSFNTLKPREPIPYRAEPIPFFAEPEPKTQEETDKKVDAARDYFMNMAKAYNKKFKKKESGTDAGKG